MFFARRLMFLVLGLFLLSPSAMAQSPAFESAPALDGVFAGVSVKTHAEVTFALYDVAENRLLGYAGQRAARRFTPASTFKIPNSLIGLSTGAVSDTDAVFYKHDGKPKYLKSWEKDMNLREAIKVSCVPAYQTLARRIGLAEMRRMVRAFAYGNAETGERVDQFWLEGPLAISAVEQTLFLARLAQGQLPCPPDAQTATRDICRLESGDGWTLYGKTGLATQKPVSIGWFVGWVERGDRTYTFALNMDITDNSALPLRIELAKTALRTLQLIDGNSPKETF